jgi:hypothetical protein
MGRRRHKNRATVLGRRMERVMMVCIFEDDQRDAEYQPRAARNSLT